MARLDAPARFTVRMNYLPGRRTRVLIRHCVDVFPYELRLRTCSGQHPSCRASASRATADIRFSPDAEVKTIVVWEKTHRLHYPVAGRFPRRNACGGSQRR